MDSTRILAVLQENKKEFLTFLKSKYKVYHLSNIFFRDVHYAVRSYLEWKGMKMSYPEAEEVALRLVSALEAENILTKIDGSAYLLKYPEFKKPAVKPAAPAKPAAAKPAAPAKPAPAPAETAKTEPAPQPASSV